MKTIFFDVDTQLDFMAPAGALYVPGAERIEGTLRKLTAMAAAHDIPIVSTMDAHLEDDLEFKSWPHHCVKTCLGQRKIEATLAPSGAQQIFIEKQHVDCFTNRQLPQILGSLDGRRYVVYGVVTEVCVRHAITGLLKTGAQITLLLDAIKELDAQQASQTIADFQLSGMDLGTSDSLVL